MDANNWRRARGECRPSVWLALDSGDSQSGCRHSSSLFTPTTTKRLDSLCRLVVANATSGAGLEWELAPRSRDLGGAPVGRADGGQCGRGLAVRELRAHTASHLILSPAAGCNVAQLFHGAHRNVNGMMMSSAATIAASARHSHWQNSREYHSHFLPASSQRQQQPNGPASGAIIALIGALSLAIVISESVSQIARETLLYRSDNSRRHKQA